MDYLAAQAKRRNLCLILWLQPTVSCSVMGYTRRRFRGRLGRRYFTDFEMKMTLRERILAVYRGEQPDVVPYMLDLSHWFYHRHGRPWDLSVSYVEPERDLIAYHQEQGVG